MANWRVVADLLDLRAEFNALGPARDKGADGTIGDAAHQARSSDHNPDDTPGSVTPHSDSDSVPEVHALDVDSSGPWLNGATMAKAVAVLLSKMRLLGSSAPLAFVIWDYHIYENPKFLAADYGGDDPHTGHAHFSSRYGSGSGSGNPENYTGSWGIREAFLMLSPEDKSWITSTVNAANAAAVDDFLRVKIGDPDVPNRTVGDVLRDAADVRKILRFAPGNAEYDGAGYPPESSLLVLTAAAHKILAGESTPGT